MHPAELSCSLTELHCTNTVLLWTLLSYAVPTLLSFAAAIWSTMDPLVHAAPIKQCCILMSFCVPLWALQHPSELCCTLLSLHPSQLMYPTELRCTFWDIHPTMLHCILHSSPFSAMLHPSELQFALWPTLPMLHRTELHCTLLRYTAPSALCWTLHMHPTELNLPFEFPFYLRARMYPTELCCMLLSFTGPFWAKLHPTEQPDFSAELAEESWQFLAWFSSLCISFFLLLLL